MMEARREASAIVIGGGPAGLFLAARAGALAVEAGARILVLEKMAKPGRKLLASGGGACNITHRGEIGEFLGRYGGKGRFLKKALFGFTNADLEAWLGERGIALEAEEGGKLFPVSRRASDILGVLLAECSRYGASIVVGARVSALRREDGLFAVETAGPEGSAATYRAPFVAIASGGRSYPGTGSDGEGYALALALGHSIVEPKPALSPVSVNDWALRELSGIGFENLSYAIRRGARLIGRSRGDVLITREGLSGPGVLDASRGFEPGDVLELDFSGRGLEAFRSELASRVAAAPRALTRTIVGETGLPRRLAELVCSLAGCGKKSAARLSRARSGRRSPIDCEFPARIASVGGFDKAMATAGGVSLREVEPSTMASRLAEDLYFAGEVLKTTTATRADSTCRPPFDGGCGREGDCGPATADVVDAGPATAGTVLVIDRDELGRMLRAPRSPPASDMMRKNARACVRAWAWPISSSEDVANISDVEAFCWITLSSWPIADET